MVKLSVSLFSSVLLVLPAILAVPLRQRSLESESDIYGRAVAQIEDYITAREHFETLYGRELGDLEKREVVKFLDRREPLFFLHPTVPFNEHEIKKVKVELSGCEAELEGFTGRSGQMYRREPLLGVLHTQAKTDAVDAELQDVRQRLASCKGKIAGLKAQRGQ